MPYLPHTVDMAGFGERLHMARRKAGLTQITLARECQLAVPNLNMLERGKGKGLRVHTLLALADRLGVSTDYLLGRCEEMTHG
jgi:transcriptional regulator with XRE-family HTH domain